MKILVTGGAGYIGSFMTKRLLDEGYDVIVLDSLERGNKYSLNEDAEIIEGNLLDNEILNKIFSSNKIDGVIHFAGFISMGESMVNPGLYFRNNTFATLNLLEQMIKNSVSYLVFSSTAGVYGNPTIIPIPEEHQKKPENPYGESKLMVESILSWYHKIHNLSYTALRYFNASGAALDGSMGEAHSPESHIIPNAIKSLISEEEFQLFGDDYNTPDGTCVRDYIHVLDLVEAHVLALNKMKDQPGGYTFNVGTGKGYSNKEILEMIGKVAGKEVKLNIKPRRLGDADTLVADANKIRSELNFTPKYSDLETIIKSAWAWHSKSSSK